MSNLSKAKELLAEERNRMKEIFFSNLWRNDQISYNPRVVRICILNRTPYCQCAPGGPMGCTPYSLINDPVFLAQCMANLEARQKIVLEEYLGLLRLALEEEKPSLVTADGVSSDPLDRLLQESEYFNQK
jgi:hypothetical protein